MNTLRRVGLVAVSCIIFLLSIICPASALDNVEEPLFTRQDLIDLGYLSDSDGVLYVPFNHFDPLNVSNFLITEKNFPDFDPSKIPWSDSPQYIKDILSIGYEYFNNSGSIDMTTQPYIVPFVGVRVSGSTAQVYVGYNLCLATHTSSHRVVLCVPSNFYDGSYYSRYRYYRASFRISDMTMITPWYDASSDASPWGDTGYLYSLTSSWISETGSYDLYFYGANVDYKGRNVATVNYPLLTNDENSSAQVFVDYPNGFYSNRFVLDPSYFQNTYISSFTPSVYGSLDNSAIGDYDSANEQLGDLVGNPDDIFSDFFIDFDTDSWSVVFDIFAIFITQNSFLMTLILSTLALGFFALVLGR